MKWGNQLHASRNKAAHRKCLVPTCPANCYTVIPMCEKHWNRVPLSIRNRIVSNSDLADMQAAKIEAAEFIHNDNIRLNRMWEEKRKAGK